MGQIFAELYECSGRNIKLESDLSYFGTKADLKEANDINTSTLASKTDLANVKSKNDQIDLDKPKTFLANLS